MREIKFRGKNGKKWVYGNYYKVKSFFSDKVAHFIGIIRSDHLTDFNIDENTLGQYTGLKDKNAREIYEGDIVKVFLSCKGDYIKAEVKYSEEYAQFIIINTGTVIHEAEALGDYTELEIIGNVYENKELLEE